MEYGYWDEAVAKIVYEYDPQWARSYFGPELNETMGISAVYVLDGDNRSVLSVELGEFVERNPMRLFDGRVDAMIAQARDVPIDGPPVVARSILSDGTTYHLVAALRMTDYGERDGEEYDIGTDHVMLFTEALDAARIAFLSKHFRLPNLRVSDTPPSFWQAGYRLPGKTPAGEFLIWSPDLPGTTMLPYLGLGLVAVFLAMAWAASSHLNRSKEVAQSLDEARYQAERASVNKTDFLRQISHEVRTPIGAMRGFAEVMQQQVFGPLGHPKYKSYAADIVAASDHVLGLVNDLLDLERIEAGAVKVEFERFDLSQAISETVHLFEQAAQDKSISLEVDLAHRVSTLNSDPRLIRQILINLVGNALKFTPEGGRITCRTRQEDAGDLIIEVEDNGCGMAPHQIPLVMQPFGQIGAAGDGRVKGSGLGLPITKRLAGLLGGRFDLESAVGQGTTASLRLPLPPEKTTRPPAQYRMGKPLRS